MNSKAFVGFKNKITLIALEMFFSGWNGNTFFFSEGLTLVSSLFALNMTAETSDFHLKIWIYLFLVFTSGVI